jgi:serine/threonine-protein kinase RsbW
MVLASEHQNVEQAVEQAESFFKEHVGDEDLLYNLVLLTSEAVTNGMEHGNDFDPGKSVVVEFKVMPAALEITVEDEGPGFERKRVPSPLSEDHLFDDGGRGLFLLESLADDVRYELGGRRTRVTFRR